MKEDWKILELRQTLANGDCVLAPGVYDCVSARMAEYAGFETVSISGYGVRPARSRLHGPVRHGGNCGPDHASLGIAFVIYPFTSLFVVAKAMQDFYRVMKDEDRVMKVAAEHSMTPFGWFGEFIGVERAREREDAAPKPDQGD